MVENLILLAIIILIIYYYCKKYSRNRFDNNKYCNKYGICVDIDNIIKSEFESMKKIILNYYNNLIISMEKDYPNDKRIRRLKRNFNINRVWETFPNNKDNDTSFTIDKKNLNLCIRSGKNFYQIENINTVKFVLTHELAHMITISHQHTPEYWTNFRWLLSIAKNNNLMIVKDYSKYPESYCGMNTDITYNPYFDDSIPLN
jgi:hypothetical protein